jgi:peptide/nickel transport system substrate-binding protein
VDYLQGELSGLDPAFNLDTNAWTVVENIYQGLIFYYHNSTTVFEPVLATNWNVSSDGKTYTFNLRQGVKFSDGVAFNAYDVWFNYYRMTLANPPAGYIIGPATFTAGNITLNDLNTFNFTSPTSSQLAVMENTNQSIQVVNQYTIAFHFPSVFPSFLARLAAIPGEIMDPNVVQLNGGVQGNSTPNTYVGNNGAPGTGPYVPTQWIHGTSLTLTANPNYWGPEPAFSTVVIQFKSNALNAINDIKTGAAQMLYATPFNLATTLQGTSGVSLQTNLPTFDAFFVSLNTARYPLNITDVRLAMIYAVDRPSMVQSLLHGFGSVYQGPLPIGMPGYNASISPLPYNVTMAKQLLATAGFPNGTGIPTLKLDLGTDPFSATIAQTLQSYWSAIGINIQINPLAGSALNAVLLEPQPRASDYPDLVAITPFSPDYAYPDDYAFSILNYNSIIDQSNLNDSQINTWTNALLSSPSLSNTIALCQNITLREQSLGSNLWLFVAAPGVPAYASNLQFLVPPNPMTFGFNYSSVAPT